MIAPTLRSLVFSACTLVSLSAQNPGDSSPIDLKTTELISRSASGPAAVIELKLRRALSPDGRIRVLADAAQPIELKPDPNQADIRFLIPVPMPKDGRATATAEITEGDHVTSRSIEYGVPDGGWTLHLNPGFHFDPVWWNTQAHYVEDGRYQDAQNGPGIGLVEEYLALLDEDSTAKVALHQLPYLKTFLEARPDRRQALHAAIRSGRAALVGGTYNELQSTLVSGEAIARNAIYGTLFQRDVLGGDGSVFWQCDVFGHDPSFPMYMAQTGHTSGAFARGPFHQWGIARDLVNFPSEFEWVSPDGTGVLTHYMTGHYGYAYAQLAGGTNLAPDDPRRGDLVMSDMFHDLKRPALTHHVMLPLHSDFIRPMRNLGALVKRWNATYESPTVVIDRPDEFFAAVRKEVADRKIVVPSITRDMNPIYTGCGVSFADLKLANRACETTLRDAEILATIAWLEGAPYPSLGLDRCWRQLLFCAHHDGVTGSMSDQVYLDVMAAYHDCLDLAASIRERAMSYLGGRMDTASSQPALAVWNTLGAPRASTRLVRTGSSDADTFVSDLPAVGFVVSPPSSAPTPPGSDGTIENFWLRLVVTPRMGGLVRDVVWKPTGKSIWSGPCNRIVELDEYPILPGQGEGPWHIATTGRRYEPNDVPAVVQPPDPLHPDEIVVVATYPDFTKREHIRLAPDAPRIEFTTEIIDWKGKDKLLRAEFAANLRADGAAPIYETAAAIVGRPFSRDVDVSQDPWTLDETFSQFFGLASSPATPAIAEIVVASTAAAERWELANAIARRLGRAGVTSTITRSTARRYGDLKLDSDHPGLRILVGPADELPESAVPGDLKVIRMEKLEDVGLVRDRMQDPVGPTSMVVISNGAISGHVSQVHGLGLNLLRSTTGWPSGLWIDPPARRLPDGAPFETMHGTHVFHYALQFGFGDWREADFPWHAQAFNQPALSRLEAKHEGPLGRRAEFVRVEPRGVLLQALKAAGNPEAKWEHRTSAPGPKRVVLRLWNSRLRDDTAKIAFRHPLKQVWITDLLETPLRSLTVKGDAVEVPIGSNAVVTVLAELDAREADADAPSLDPTEGDRSPSAYWRENLAEGVTGNGMISVVPSPKNGILAIDANDADEHAVSVDVLNDRREASAELILAVEAPQNLQVTLSKSSLSVAAGGRETITLKFRRKPDAPPGRSLVTVIATIPSGRTVTGSFSVCAGVSADAPVVAIENAAPLAVAGTEIRARIENLTDGPITGVATWLMPFVSWPHVPAWRRTLTIPPRGSITVDAHVGDRLPPSFALLRFCAGGTITYGETIGIVTRREERVLRFSGDRIRLRDGQPTKVTVSALSLGEGPAADVTIEAPGGIAVTRGGQTSVRHERHAVQTTDFELTRTGGPTRGDLRARVGEGATTTVAYTVAPELHARPTIDKVKADGDLSDWAPEEFASVQGKLGSMRGAVRYGATGLAVAIDVTDDVFCQPEIGTSCWKGDSVQIAVSVAPSTSLGYDARDLEFGAALTIEGPIVWCWYGGDGGKTGRVVDAPVGIVKRDDGHIVYEFVVPSTVLPRVTLTPGTRLGFGFIANDNDGDGYRGATEWTPGLTGTKDSSQFGELLLE